MASFEEEYFNVLKAIEGAIVATYGAQPDAKDRHAEAALNGLARYYSAALKNKRPPDLKLKPTEQAFYNAVKGALTAQMSDTTEQTITMDEAVACIKRIQRSARQMLKAGGPSGTHYLDFVRDYHSRTTD